MSVRPSPDELFAVARAMYDAFAAGDRARMEALVAEGFRFTSPLDNRIDRRTYFERCWPNTTSITGFDLVHWAADGERIFVTYEGRTAAKRFRNTEILTVRGGQVCEVEVYFGWNIPHDAARGGSVPPT